MRALGFVAAAVLLPGLLLSDTGLAQDWVEYIDPEEGFSINFPAIPKISETSYTTASGAIVPATVYSAERDGSRYTLTVVNYAGQVRDQRGAIRYAAGALRATGEVTYDASVDLDGIPGRHVTTVQPDGRRIEAVIYQQGNRVYIAEGHSPPHGASAAQFYQSIVILDPSGARIVIPRG